MYIKIQGYRNIYKKNLVINGTITSLNEQKYPFTHLTKLN